jgi:glycosyltransferase involved in cell wall biosynthesis
MCCSFKEVGAMSELLGVSIIIVNYNNAEFLAAAIDSALSQNHPYCEVIVVDDCSTDDSRTIIARYGHWIRSVLREANGHQIAALNSAWPLARYPILIFLDSDDILFSHAAATIASHWSDETVKMQAPLVTIDRAGRQLPHVAPKYPPNLDTATIRTELLRTGGSPNSAASGNAYSRSLLEAVTRDGGFDLENSRDHWMDGILEMNAPFYGEVVTLYEPLAGYRLYDGNATFRHTIESARFAYAFRNESCRLDYFARRCQSWGLSFDPAAAYNRSIYLLECRLAADKLASVKDPTKEPTWRTLSRGLKACMDAHLPISNRIIRGAWFVIVAISPRIVARRLIALRYCIPERPAWLEPLLGIIVNISSWGRPLPTPTSKR